MKANLRRIRKKRVYSDEFKKELVSDFESGKYSVLDLVRLHGVSKGTIYNWIYKFSTFNSKGYRVIEMTESSTNKVKELEARVKELEGTVGRKQIMIDYLETMIDVAKEELDIDIKKNYSTPQSVKSNRKNKR
jgi:transposase-like protein